MRWIMTYRRWIFATPLLTGCVIFESRATNQLAELQANQAVWEAAGLVDYTMYFQRQCVFCPPEIINPVELTIREDTIQAVFDLELQVPQTEWIPGAYLTVPEMYLAIQEAIDQLAAQIDILYDATLGFPTDVHIDFNRRFTDDDIDIVARDVVAIN